MDELFTRECLVCKKNEEEIILHKCPVCFRYFCVDHAFTAVGRQFCSQRCARYMFSPDEDED